MKFELFYPQWKDRAVTFSYDDGQIFDRRLVDIFNKYNFASIFFMLCMHNLKLFLKKTGTLSFFKESLLFITAI